MAEDAQPAARVEDHVQHTQAMLGRRIGGAFGLVAGIAVLAGAIVLAGGLEVVTGGLATPVLIGAGMVVVGGLMGATSAFSDVGADIGRGHFEDEGPIASGEKTVLVGKERWALAHVGSNVSCKRDKHPDTPTIDFPNPAFEQIVQGSDTVLVGIGSWQVSRIGSKGTCGFAVAQGCTSVIIGGPTGTHGPLGNDDPEADNFHLVGAAGGWIMLGGVLLMSGPFAAVAAYGIGKLIGKGLEYLPEGLPRDSVAAVLSLLPMAGLPKAMGSIRAATNEGLVRGTGETPEEFQARVKDTYNARVAADFRAKIEASKPRGAWIPTDAFGRPIPVTEAARANGAGGMGGVLGPRGVGGIDPTRAPVMMSQAHDEAYGSLDGANSTLDQNPRLKGEYQGRADKLNQDLADARELEKDPQYKELAEEEYARIQRETDALNQEMQGRLPAPNPREQFIQNARNTPPSEYSGAKHWQGTTEAERQQSSMGRNPGQYNATLTEPEVASMERQAFLEGTVVPQETGTYYAYYEFDHPIGYEGGRPTNWIRAEMTGVIDEQGGGTPDMHSHPIPPPSPRMLQPNMFGDEGN